jgi:hypothetical protein
LSHEWVAYHSTGAFINLVDTTLMGPQTNSAAYAMVYVYSPVKYNNLLESPRTVHLLTGYDDGMVLWVNGERLLDDDKVGPHVFDHSKLGPIKLQQGWNRLMVKVSQWSGDWGFSLRMMYNDGTPAQDMIFSLEPPE